MFWAGVDAISTCAGEDPQKNGAVSPLNCSCPVVVAGPGDVFGDELALLYNCPRAASVEAGGRPSILMYFASVWIRLLVVDSWHQTLAAPTARKATEEAVVWQLDRETFSHIVRDASAKRREAFQDFLNLGQGMARCVAFFLRRW